jgi:hypothetical protein
MDINVVVPVCVEETHMGQRQTPLTFTQTVFYIQVKVTSQLKTF